MRDSYIVLYVIPVTFIEIIGVFTIFLLYFCYDCYYAFQTWFNYVYYISTFNIKIGPNFLLCKINVYYVLKLNIHFSQIEKNTPPIISLYSSNNFVVGKTWVRMDRPGFFFWETTTTVQRRKNVLFSRRTQRLIVGVKYAVKPNSSYVWAVYFEYNYDRCP